MPEHATGLRPVMDEAEFDRERQRLLELYGDPDAKSVEVIAKRDQAFAQFYFRSGWTQDRIAAKEGRSVTWVQYRLRLGRFMAFSAENTMVLNAKNLSERRFRDYWEKTDKNEPNDNVRFRAVLRAMENDVTMQHSRAPKGIGPLIMADFADGDWHKFDTIRDKLDCDADDLETTLRWMEQRGTHKSKVESKPYGTGKMYRIMRAEKMISSHELAIKLSPLIKAMMAEGNKTMARWSPATIKHLAFQMQSLLDGWTE